MGQSVSELHAIGQSLAGELRGYARRPDVVVLACGPSLVPLAAEVAQALEAPLDLFLVAPLMVAEPARLRIGAVASGGVLILDSSTVKAHAIPAGTIAGIAQAEARALALRDQAYRGDRPSPDLRHQRVIVVVDGRHDPSALRMTIAALRRRWVERVVLAAPTMSPRICRALLADADEIVTALTPETTIADQAWTEDDADVSAGEVSKLLRRTA